jgi:hypothetical protein
MSAYQNITMDYVSRGVDVVSHVNKIHLELAWMAYIWIFWSAYIRQNTATDKYVRVYRLPRVILPLHVGASVIELVRYYSKLGATGAYPVATSLDAVLCVVHSVSSLWLTSGIHRSPRGPMEVIRATFQIMAFQRLFATYMALNGGGLGQDEIMWHRSSIKMFQAFSWARFLLIIAPKYVTGMDTFAKKLTTGLVGGELLAMWEGDYPCGIGMYAGLMGLLLAFDRWAQGLSR